MNLLIKNGKKIIVFLLIIAMVVTCIPQQQVNAKTTAKKVAVTRAEWVCALLKQTDIKNGKISKYHFSDTKKNATGKAIETAYASGILPVKKKSKKFYPNKAATREFMAVTAVRALRFQTDKTAFPNCKDKKKLSYPHEDKVALNQKILSLKKKQFLPQKAITKEEKKKALRVVKKISSVGKVDSKHKNVIAYQKNVEKIPVDSQKNYTVRPQGDMLVVSVPKNEDTQNIQTGKVVIFPKESGTQNQIALKVKSVIDTGNGMIEITGETPDVSEVYQKIDLQKKKQVDMSAFVPNDEVVASVRNLSSGLRGAGAQVTVSVGEGRIIELKEQKIGKVGTFSGSVELPAPKVTAVVEADFSKRLNPVYHEVSVSLSEDVTAKAELKFSSKGKGSDKIYLGHVSSYLGDGFYADVVFYLNISADGKATIQYKLSNTLTASYINGDFRINADSNGSWEGTQAEVNGQLLGEPQVNLRLLGYWFDEKLYGSIDIIGVQADAGAKLKATATVHDTKPKLCTNLDVYGYASVGVNTDFGIGKWLKNHTKLTLTKVILDNNAANPLRRTWHYEDGKRTEGDKCTYKQKSTENKNNDTKTNQDKEEKNKIDIKNYKDGNWKKEYVKKMNEWEKEQMKWEEENSVNLSENIRRRSKATLIRIPNSKVPLLVYYYRSSVVVIFYDKNGYNRVNCFGGKTTSSEGSEIEFYYSSKKGKGYLNFGGRMQSAYSFNKNGAKLIFQGRILSNYYYLDKGVQLEKVTGEEYYTQFYNALGDGQYQPVSSMDCISGKDMKKLLLQK